MFNPNNLIFEEIDFDNRNEVYQFVALTHAYFSTKPLNIVMQEKLIQSIYDKRLHPAISFKLLVESYNRWMLVEDQPMKRTFVYLFGIFKNLKDEYLQAEFKKQSAKTLEQANEDRIKRAAEERESSVGEANALLQLLKQNKHKIGEEKSMLLFGLIKTNKLLRARIEIEEAIGVK